MVASWARACAANITKKAAKRIARREPLRFTAKPKLPANVDERNFIWSLRVIGRDLRTPLNDVAVSRAGTTLYWNRLRCYMQQIHVVKNKIDILGQFGPHEARNWPELCSCRGHSVT